MDGDALEAAARAILPKEAFDYFAGGAFDERSLAANLEDWAGIRLRPRVLRDVTVVDTGTSLLGHPGPTPVVVAPTAFHRMAHPDGESGSAKGAAAAGAHFVLSTRSTTPVEQVADALEGRPFWYQVYVLQDRGLTVELVDRAKAAGATALVLTVDVARLGRRLRDLVNEFVIPAHLGTIESLDRPDGGADQDPGLTFDDIGWLRESTGLPVVVKGVLRPGDARRCLDAGASAVWVSNHGGRQLDYAATTADRLAAVVAEVGSSTEVYVDGGIRNARHALVALGLGARAVFLGRLPVYALAAEGSGGVRRMFQELAEELADGLMLTGCATVGSVPADLVTRA